MLKSLRKTVNAALDTEGRKLLTWIRTDLEPGSKILDVGCGFGRRLKLLKAAGYSTTGIEVNPAIVSAVRKEGLECILPDEFLKKPFEVEALIFSHVIEHFAPDALLKFMSSYLAHLKPGGKIFIATPLMSASFYDDFDHVKPYQPAGLIMVFVESMAQVQFQSDTSLKLRRLWYRRSPFRLTHYSGLYLGGVLGKLEQGVNLAFQLLFLVSFGILGRKDGWVGEFMKTSALASDMRKA